MLGFQRHEGIKTSLGLGEYAPLFKNLKEGLDRYFTGKDLWSTGMGLPSYEILWKHQVDRGGGNCHVISGIVDRKKLDTPMDRDVLIMARNHLKTVFAINQCKLIAVESYPSNKRKIYRKYGFEDDVDGKNGLIVIKYSKL
jgi:hypothetical protein